MVSPRLVTKIEAEEPTLRLAVLIDADNAQAAVIEGLLAEIARFGEATVKRIYGDFTAPASASWKKYFKICHQTCSAVCIYNRQKCHGQHTHHRCDGFTLYPKV